MKHVNPYVDPGIQHHHDGTSIRVLVVKSGTTIRVYAKTRKGA